MPKVKSESRSTDDWKNIKKIVKKPGAVNKLKELGIQSLSDIKNKNGKNLLHVSTKYGKVDITRYLIEAGCDVNQKSPKDGRTPLSRTFSRGGQHIAKLLLEAGADYSWETLVDKQTNLIHLGSETVKYTLFKFLRNGKSNDFKESREAAELLVSNGWPLDFIATFNDYFLILFAREAVPELNNNYIKLIKAIENTTEDEQTYLQSIKILIESLAEHKIVMSWALFYTVGIINKDHLVEPLGSDKPLVNKPLIIKFLLNCGAPINGIYGCYHKTPLIEAISLSDFDSAQALIDYGATIMNDNNFKNIAWRNYKNRNDYKEHMFHINISLLIMEYYFCKGFDSTYKKFYEILVEGYFHDLPENAWTFNPKPIFPIIKWIIKLANYGVEVRHLIYFQEKMKELHFMRFFGLSCNKVMFKYSNNCTQEILKMKDYKIGNLSVYDFFVSDVDKLIPHLRNKKIQESLKSELVMDNFEIYHDTLQFKINQVNKKIHSIDRSVDVLSDCLPLIGSSTLVLKKIVDYLGFPNKLC